MGTHACTRVQNKDDFIEAHTRWDGFGPEIKENLKDIFKGWHFTIQSIKDEISVKNYDSPYAAKWLSDMDSLLTETEKSKDITKIMGLLCGNSFNHHHVLYSSQPKGDDTLEYYGKGNPDVVYVPELNKFSKALKIKNATENDLLIDDTHFVIRIMDDGGKDSNLSSKKSIENLNTNIYVDGLTKNEFIEILTQLPAFWLENHFLLRKTKEEEIANYNKHGMLARNIFSEYNLKTFYSPEQKYERFSDSNYKDKELILDEVCASIPFDFSSNALATHLFVASAGKIRNLTEGQNKIYSQKEDLERVYIIEDESRTSMIAYKTDDFNHVKNALHLRLKKIVQELKTDINPSIPLYQIPDEDLYAFNYEKSMIEVMSILSATPTLEQLEKIKKDKEIKKNFKNFW